MKTFIKAVMLLAVSFNIHAQTVNLRLAHEFPVAHPFAQGLDIAVKHINDESKGRIKVQLLPASQLGSGREIVQQISSGTVDMGFSGAAMLGNWHKPMGVFEAPFLARDYTHWKNIFESPLSLSIQGELEKKANIIRVSNPWYGGQRHFTTRNKPVNTPDDIKNMKIRVPEVPHFLDMIRSLGAQPTPMPLAEVYLALQTGVIDGQENPLPTINGAKLHEVQKFISLTGHVISGLWPIANNKSWAKLTDQDRQLILQALSKGQAHSDNIMFTQETNLINEFKSKGVTFTNPDKAAFARAMEAVYLKNEEAWGKGVVANLQKVK